MIVSMLSCTYVKLLGEVDDLATEYVVSNQSALLVPDDHAGTSTNPRRSNEEGSSSSSNPRDVDLPVEPYSSACLLCERKTTRIAPRAMSMPSLVELEGKGNDGVDSRVVGRWRRRRGKDSVSKSLEYDASVLNLEHWNSPSFTDGGRRPWARMSGSREGIASSARHYRS